jgi:type II secretion system protein J
MIWEVTAVPASVSASARAVRPLGWSARQRRAFSLLELLVAITIVAILAASLYGVMRVAFKARDSGEAAVEPPRTAEMALTVIQQDLESALPPGQATGSLVSEFYGQHAQDGGRDVDGLAFCAAVAGGTGAVGDSDIKRIEYAIVTDTAADGTTDHVLVRRVIANPLGQPDAPPVEEVVCRGVAAFTVQYYDGYEWLTDWQAQNLNSAWAVSNGLQPTDSTTGTGTTGAAGATGTPSGSTGAATGTATASVDQTGTTGLPLAVQVTLVLDRTNSDGSPKQVSFTRWVHLPLATLAGEQAATDTSGTTGTGGTP